MKIISIVLFLLINLYAHKLNLFLSYEKNQVFVSSYYASGSTCKKCKIQIYNGDNKLFEEGLTNNEGEYVITNLKSSKIIVRVETIDGHAATRNIKIENIKNNNQQETYDAKQESVIKSIIAIIFITFIFLFLKRLKQ
ncbi:MAG: hypothetical protein GY932_08400 [Arcobacter sp.]|nr:hypothetical protein [Arcobacter sp.]